MLACNSAEFESREPVLQHAMYYRLYHRSWFAGRKTYARHVPGGVPQRVCATRLSVDRRRLFNVDLRVTEAPQQPIG